MTLRALQNTWFLIFLCVKSRYQLLERGPEFLYTHIEFDSWTTRQSIKSFARELQCLTKYIYATRQIIHLFFFLQLESRLAVINVIKEGSVESVPIYTHWIRTRRPRGVINGSIRHPENRESRRFLFLSLRGEGENLTNLCHSIIISHRETSIYNVDILVRRFRRVAPYLHSNTL